MLSVHFPLQLLLTGWPGAEVARIECSLALAEEIDARVLNVHLPMRTFLGRRFSSAAMNSWDELRRFPKLCLNSTHCGTTGSDLLSLQAQLAGRIAHIHLSDYADNREHLAIGHGTLPLDRFLHVLVAHDYTGTVVVELAPRALPLHDEAEIAVELRRHLEFCRRYLGQHVTDSPSPA